jgi:carbonic anhydrase/acetyltransferase-like protein (isoleucine patch superfamily)
MTFREDYLHPVGRGAVFIEHQHGHPRVDESAYIAPTAVLCGDVTVGPHSRVLFGAVLTAEGGPVRIGTHCVIMEHAVLRGSRRHPVHLGDHVLVGPHAHLSGCVIEGEARIATGAMVYNGARLGTGADVGLGAVVHVNTVLPAGVAVPMGWFAGGDPVQLIPPGEWERIAEVMGPLDYPGTVFGITGAPGESVLSRIAQRYARALALHRYDQTVTPELISRPRSPDPR